MVVSWAGWVLFLGVAALQWGLGGGAATIPSDLLVLQQFLGQIQNPKLLSNWNDNDPCGSRWAHIKCTGSSVSALEMSGLGLGGGVTPELNKLKSLVSVQLQGNGFTGPLPSLAGLSALTEAYFGGNSFDSIPADFFSGLSSLTHIFLDDNHLNATQGWSLPPEIIGCSKLDTLSATNTSLVGTIPEFLGAMSSLRSLSLAYNKFHGGIPANFSRSNLVLLRLNNQLGSQPLTGPISPVASMQSLMTLWLQVNQFSGIIPPDIGDRLPSLGDLRLNDNQFVGLLPQSLAQLPALKNFTIKGNRLVGPMPQLGVEYDGSSNGFCQEAPGKACDARVSALLTFADSANGFTSTCTANWKGNDPCGWNGIGCSRGSVISIQLPNCQLTGNISESLATLEGLTIVNLKDNALTGVVPAKLVQMASLKTLNLFNNQLSGPVPASRPGLDLNVGNNPLGSPSSGGAPGSSTAQGPGSSGGNGGAGGSGRKKISPVVTVVIPVVAGLVAIAAAIGVYVVCRKKGGSRFIRVQSSSAIVVHPRDSSFERQEALPGKSPARNSGPSEVLDGSNLMIPIYVLRKATQGFSEDRILGRGGFGVVYKGDLDDGTRIAVKRMESAVINNKGLSEFQAEIEVLTKVRHRHLVALLGYCIEGNEKLLVYEFMPQGTLSQHLFDCNKPGSGIRPLTWKQRLSIALDMARGIEYLHGLAHKSFIHRDLKPSNILLDDSLHAKVSDFGLVKLAPEGKVSVETRLAGTFGYLAPEYAVTGRVTTKVDLYSFGVILMELITGRQALDASRSEDTMHLPSWFRRIRMNRESLRASLDPLMEVSEEEFEGVSSVAELAGHCTMREPYQRPDMSHAVNVLAPMVERWKPSLDFDAEEANGSIDLGVSLSEALRRWQAGVTTTGGSGTQEGDSGGLDSFPTRPPGFAESFKSGDVR